jgi:hypothetical protein
MMLHSGSGYGLLFDFSRLIKHVAGLLWTSDQLVAKACTYSGQHNI